MNRTDGRRGAARRQPAAAALLTADEVRIQAVHRPCSAAAGGETAGRGGDGGTAVVLAHGFSGALSRPAVQRVADVLVRDAGVVCFSFRGHGTSGGRSTVGDREVLDVEAACAWARSLGYRRVVTLGFSMGGAVVLRHAALRGRALLPGGPPGRGVDAVAAVSSPGHWYYKGTAPMRRLHWAVQRPEGRFVARWLLHTRIVPHEWAEAPMPPDEAAAAIAAPGEAAPGEVASGEGSGDGTGTGDGPGRGAPTPLLLVHGDADPYFPVQHARDLYAAAGGGAGPAQLWIEPGMGHAENGADAALVRRIGAWLRRAALATDPATRVPSAPDRGGDGAGRGPRTKEGA